MRWKSATAAYSRHDVIESVSANRDSFKSVEFGPAFNVVLAERSEQSRDKDSRNGSGKTSLVEVIHFCLGATFDDRHPLSHQALKDWRFDLRFTARGETIQAARSVETASRVYLSETPTLPVLLRSEADGNGSHWVPNDEWRGLALGWLFFALTEADLAEPGSPSARTLLSYFARRGRDAFSDPFTFFRSQPAVQRQVANAFLLGIDWRYPARAQQLRERTDQLQNARKALANAPGLGHRHDAPPADTLEGELEARVILLGREVAEAAQQLATFRVHPQYHEIENQTSELTRMLHELSVENISELELLEFYELSVRDEQAPDPQTLEAIYAEAGVVFPDGVSRRLDEVRDFYGRLIANRRGYLESEMSRLRASVRGREMQIADLTERRGQLMDVLREHGALDEFQRLQDLHNEKVGQLERIKGQLEALQSFEEELSRVRLAREQLVLDARVSFNDARPAWTTAVDIFGANTAALYEDAGRLEINVNEQGGLSLGVHIARGESQGVQEMMVLCYDLMLAELWSKHSTTPGFVIHDSTIFDGVDERQVARALQLAAAKAEEHGFQYICLLNSDGVPRAEFADGFPFDDGVVLELSDLGDNGGLFGIRF